MYAVVKQSLPTLRAFTVCLWLRPAEGGIGTPLSYAVPAQPNELVLLQGLHTPTELLVNDKVLTQHWAKYTPVTCLPTHFYRVSSPLRMSVST